MPGVVRTLVVDSGPLIKGAKPETLSNDVHSVREVVSEIRDPATRQRLAVLPYEINFREPSPASIKFITEFAKKTGDFSVLSAIDIKVMALTHQLLLETDPDAAAKLRDAPAPSGTPGCSENTDMQATSSAAMSGHLAGFYMPKSKASNSPAALATATTASSTAMSATCDSSSSSSSITTAAAAAATTTTEMTDEASQLDCTSVEDGVEGDACRVMDESNDQTEGNDDGNGDEENDNDDDGGGWITPSNIAQVKKEMRGGDVEAVSDELAVACMTTDYAMQNVLMQIGLPVLSVDGMLIRTVRTYVLRCTACMKVSSKVTSVFCPRCGNDALVRVLANTRRDGQVVYGNFGRKALNQRGTTYSLPLPKGGRLAVNPILNPDQKNSYCPPRSRGAAFNALDADYVSESSPFVMNDVTSRGVNIAFRNKSGHGDGAQRAPGQRRPNPNASKPRKKKR